MKGKQQTETSEATAGDIVTAVKINASTFDTLCSPERKVLFENYLFLFHAIQWQYAAHRVMKAKFQPAFKEYLTKTKP